VWGSSSGAALALDAAARGLAISRLALWEPPYRLQDGGPRPPVDTAKVFTELISQGRRGDAVEFFMAKVVRLPDEFVAQARNAPFWKAQEALAHTLAYDAIIMGDDEVPAERVASVTTPTLVLTGGASPPVVARHGTSDRRPAARGAAAGPGGAGAQRRPPGPRPRAGGVLRQLTLHRRLGAERGS
jgi:hypothetical protein